MNLQQFRTELIENGGSTYNFNSHKPTPETGYMVSIKGKEQTYKFADTVNIKSYVIANIADLLEDDKFLGGWEHNGIYYLDVSVHFDDLKEAQAFGRANDQIAIYDLSDKTEIVL